MNADDGESPNDESPVQTNDPTTGGDAGPDERTVRSDPIGDPEPTLADRLPSPRTFVIGAVGFVAVVAILVGILGFWTLRVAADSDRFESRVEDLLRTEEVSDALARRIVSEVADEIALGEALDEAVPEVLRPAVNVLLAGVRSRVELGLADRLRQDRFVELVGAASGAAHETAVRVLRGDDVVDGVTIVDGEVTVNLLPVVGLALGLFQEVGLFQDAALPDLTRGGDPDEQRAELSAALGRDLDPGFGEIVVLTSDALAETGSTVDVVRDTLELARRTFWILLPLGLGFAALAIWLSVQRWRAASFLVAGLFAGALIVKMTVGRARDRVPDVVEQPGARATVEELARGLEQSLTSTLLVVSVAALVALVATAFVTARYPRPEG